MRPEQPGAFEHLSRRYALQLGAFGLSTLNPGFATANTEQKVGPARADNCILLFLNGGPSHLDMWDMKPDGPPDIRGEFQPIQSSLPGVLLSEHLPRLAQQMHHTTLIRSMNHSVNNSHAAAVYAALTGHDRGELGGGAKPTDRPSPGSVLAWLRPPENHTLPYVALPYKTKEGAKGPLQPGFLAGLMGQTYDPFWVLNNPNNNDFHVDNLQLPVGMSSERMKNRARLLRELGRGIPVQNDRSVSAIDDFRNQVFELLTSNAAQQAFDLERESTDTRARYGRNIYGQSTLLARRLVEAGTRFVTLSWAEHANQTWDTHGNNFKNLKNRLLPEFDAACSSLLQDLADRNLLDRTLVAVLGDFGRSPKINDSAGRDHWNSCYTVMLAGAGIRKGFVLGASDRYGATPTENPVTPGDVITTIYRLLGVDPTTQILDSLGRPHEVVPKGQVIQEVLA